MGCRRIKARECLLTTTALSFAVRGRSHGVAKDLPKMPSCLYEIPASSVCLR